MASGGSIFLDEIGDLPATIQVKLLRAIQERCFERIGGLRMIRTDARLIAATHVNLEEAMRTGKFREDLYYRLNVITITLPPLRERAEDVPALVAGFLRLHRKPGLEITPGAMAALARYPWSGNVRELENVIERACVIVEGDRITEADLPFASKAATAAVPPGPATPAAAPVDPQDPRVAGPGTPGFSLDAWEKRIVLEAFERSGQVKTRTAQMLGLTRRQLDSRLRRYGIDG